MNRSIINKSRKKFKFSKNVKKKSENNFKKYQKIILLTFFVHSYRLLVNRRKMKKSCLI